MNTRNEILDELGVLSPIVRNLSRETPYGVPAGYFDTFPLLVMGRLGAAGTDLAENTEPSFAIGKDKPLTFSVPEGYFEGFAQGLLDKIKAGVAEPAGMESVKEELARLSPVLSGLSRQTPYQLPEGYFEELSSLHPILAELRDKPLYTVPEGYFAGMATDVLQKLTAKERPTGHEKLTVHERSTAQEPAKVVTLGRSSRQGYHQESWWKKGSWWKYSAAAVVAGLMITIGWLRLHTSSGSLPAKVDIAGNLVKVSDQDLQSYLDDDQNDETTRISHLQNL